MKIRYFLFKFYKSFLLKTTWSDYLFSASVRSGYFSVKFVDKLKKKIINRRPSPLKLNDCCLNILRPVGTIKSPDHRV